MVVIPASPPAVSVFGWAVPPGSAIRSVLPVPPLVLLPARGLAASAEEASPEGCSAEGACEAGASAEGAFEAGTSAAGASWRAASGAWAASAAGSSVPAGASAVAGMEAPPLFRAGRAARPPRKTRAATAATETQAFHRRGFFCPGAGKGTVFSARTASMIRSFSSAGGSGARVGRSWCRDARSASSARHAGQCSRCFSSQSFSSGVSTPSSPALMSSRALSQSVMPSPSFLPVLPVSL